MQAMYASSYPMASIIHWMPQGYGAYSSAGEWFQLRWPESWSRIHITVKRLLPIVLGVALWGRNWWCGTIRCRCDNMAAVAILKLGSCKGEWVMQKSFFFLASQELRIGQWMHFCGTTKPIQVPAGHQELTTIPQVLLSGTGSGLLSSYLQSV